MLFYLNQSERLTLIKLIDGAHISELNAPTIERIKNKLATRRWE